MSELIPVLDKHAIAQKVTDVARRISLDYQGDELVVIGVLKGSFIFLADLVRQIDLPKIKMDFVQAASYGCNTQTSGCIRLLKDIDIDIKGKNVLLVDDILDSGLTLAYLLNHLRQYEPRSLKTCTLIDKRERRRNDLQPDYVCQTIEGGFLVGYGLDYAESYRNLPGIFHLKF